MALNIKNAEVEKLAGQVARLTHESKTEAIRKSLEERAARLKLYRGKQTRLQRIEAILERTRKQFPKGDFGRRLSKVEEEEILGFGPNGV
jgi:antitoxin VapB